MEPSPAKGKPQGRLLVSTTLDAKDELEEVTFGCGFQEAICIRTPSAISSYRGNTPAG